MKNFNKIKTYKEIKNITNKGSKTVLKSVILYKLESEKGNTKIEVGFLLSKKFGNAVRRNKARRRLVAAINDLKPSGNYHIVFIPRNGITKIIFSALKTELANIIT